MNKILIVTTSGCEACNIAIDNVNNALLQSSEIIEKEIKDWHDCTRNFIVENKIRDYPAVVYLNDKKVIKIAIGTYPTAVYLRWIDIYFKN